MGRAHNRNVLFISLSQLGIGFSFNFVMVFLPFFIHRISPYSSQKTLIWVGLIMGSSSFMAAVASTFWGSIGSRLNPKVLYMIGLLSHAILIFLMGFITNIPLLFVIRMIQGVLGGISTIGLIIVFSSSSQESASRNIGFFQNSMTLGQLFGPPIGAFAASTLGYKGAFISASALIFVTLIFCFFNVADIRSKPPKIPTIKKHTKNKRILAAWALCFAGTVQLMFLPGILPNVFESFGIEHGVALGWSGMLVMSYSATAMIGTYIICRLAPKINTVKLIVSVAGLGTFLQAFFPLCPGIGFFIGIRLVQTALIAAILPLTISLFASGMNGRVIGFLNSGRFAGNAVGPIIATNVLAFAHLSGVYLFISGLSILSLICFIFFFNAQPPTSKTTDPHPLAP